MTVSAAAVSPAVSSDLMLSSNKVLSIAAGTTSEHRDGDPHRGGQQPRRAGQDGDRVGDGGQQPGGDRSPADVALTLTDDDGASSLSINSPTVTEGDSGSATLTFTVTLSPASGQQVTVDWAPAADPGTAEFGHGLRDAQPAGR